MIQQSDKNNLLSLFVISFLMVTIFVSFLIIFNFPKGTISPDGEGYVRVTQYFMGEDVQLDKVRVSRLVVPVLAIPFEELWASSGHADETDEAFLHWAEDDPPVVPTRCAKCHSTQGIQDFYGVDGSAAGTVDADVDNTVPTVFQFFLYSLSEKQLLITSPSPHLLKAL